MNDGSCFILTTEQDFLVPSGASMVLPQVPQAESLFTRARRHAHFGRYQASTHNRSEAGATGALLQQLKSSRGPVTTRRHESGIQKPEKLKNNFIIEGGGA
jgi:hypothetical protein